ncbi:hypothetical protein GWK47_043464 [Chionoecetes opilio]|uniref:Uncharacterized protein n=1 Tax=Chionoecetes opilio TaxID=41210 RepID=A0A8J4YLK6_CHIOP|nr:hypothetical protein GWK47_043464 [Chionoecetes opilio]
MPPFVRVPNCKGNYRKGPRVSIFFFPKRKGVASQWLRSIKTGQFSPTASTRSPHQQETDMLGSRNPPSCGCKKQTLRAAPRCVSCISQRTTLGGRPRQQMQNRDKSDWATEENPGCILRLFQISLSTIDDTNNLDEFLQKVKTFDPENPAERELEKVNLYGERSGSSARDPMVYVTGDVPGLIISVATI